MIKWLHDKLAEFWRRVWPYSLVRRRDYEKQLRDFQERKSNIWFMMDELLTLRTTNELLEEELSRLKKTRAARLKKTERGALLAEIAELKANEEATFKAGFRAGLKEAKHE